MKKFILVIPVFVLAFAVSCNNSGGKKNPLTVQADSLEKEVMAGHNIAMPKSMKIPGLQKETKQLLDSISKLPAKTQSATASYKARLEGLLKDLSDADSVMNKWMTEYVFDSAKNNMELRIKYLTAEKSKIENVKKAVLGSLQEADSLLKH